MAIIHLRKEILSKNAPAGPVEMKGQSQGESLAKGVVQSRELFTFVIGLGQAGAHVLGKVTTGTTPEFRSPGPAWIRPPSLLAQAAPFPSC
jgi:hypothetical protein